MVLFMRPTMATSPHETYYIRDDVKEDTGIDYTQEVLDVLENRVLPSLIEASESSIKNKGCVELQSIRTINSMCRLGLQGATSLAYNTQNNKTIAVDRFD
jgi:hypothetical protein